MTEKTSEARLTGYFFGRDAARRRFDPAVAIAFGYDPRARQRNSQCAEGRGMSGEPRDVPVMPSRFDREIFNVSRRQRTSRMIPRERAMLHARLDSPESRAIRSGRGAAG